MSASVPPPNPGATPDPSMEDILASIRRILSEDEQPAKPAEGGAAGEAEVVALDESMLVAEPPAAAARTGAPPNAESARTEPPMDAPLEPPMALAAGPIAMPALVPVAPPAPERLIAPEAEAAATSSVSSLLRTLEAGRGQANGMAVHRGGPTLEDIVREEMRPLLKAWLDSNLPPLVERLVRAEIERLVGRALT